jgi:hypothetical protein
MSKERTGVFGIVVVTMLVTSGLLVAGWYWRPEVFRATNRDRTSGRGAGATT